MTKSPPKKVVIPKGCHDPGMGYRHITVDYWGAGTFRVTSETNPEESYLVDLLRDRPHGVCGCPQYEYRLRSLRRGQNVPLRCKHIDACYEWCAIRFLDAIAKERTDAANLNRQKAGKSPLRQGGQAPKEDPSPLSEMWEDEGY